MGVVLIGTKDTDNYLNSNIGEKEYTHVTTFHNLEKINLDFFRRVEQIKAEDKTFNDGGDIMDGLIVGIDELIRHCGTKKYKKRVFLITDGEKETKCSPGEFKTII